VSFNHSNPEPGEYLVFFSSPRYAWALRFLGGSTGL